MMRKSLMAIGVIVGSILVFQFFLRYKILKLAMKSGDFSTEEFYRYDRLTGKLHRLLIERKVKGPSEQAIDLAKNYLIGETKIAAATMIRDTLSGLIGKVVFHGWKADSLTGNSFLVSNTYSRDKDTLGWWFEVSVSNSLVRLFDGYYTLSSYGIDSENHRFLYSHRLDLALSRPELRFVVDSIAKGLKFSSLEDLITASEDTAELFFDRFIKHIEGSKKTQKKQQNK